MRSDLSVICPLCGDAVEKLLYRYHLDGERRVIGLIREQNPEWSEADGACSRCVDYYHTEVVMQQRILPEIGPHFPVRSADDFIILPTALRLDADQRFTGKGVTICFIDSGFYPHPDLVALQNRVIKYIDITKLADPFMEDPVEEFPETDPAAWHGTMTSVVCAGDGFLSRGLYKGIAPDANLVFLKVQDNHGKIINGNIARALQWVKIHHERFGIRIVNMSIGADEETPYRQSEICLLAEQLTDLGIVVVAAAGNDPQAAVRPPASAPRVIAVGGTDDGNALEELPHALYHSAFGKTKDQLMKPELLAPAIWIAAPILPGTREEREAAALFALLNVPAEELAGEFKARGQDISLDPGTNIPSNAAEIKEAILRRIQAAKYISPFYMHVDGTSFAAPMISAIIAQLLEARPELRPAAIRELLFSSARRIRNYPPERQGFGFVRPRHALLKILKREKFDMPPESPQVDRQQKIISFYLQHDCATQVSLAGSFNQWNADSLLLEPGNNGTWKIDIPLLPEGRYLYKFFVDEKTWLEDVNNPYREPDGFSGFNNIFLVKNETA